MPTMLKQLFVYACLIVLSACGGSSSDDRSPVTPQPGSSSASSNSSSASSVPAQDGVPQNLRVTPANQSATLQWSSVSGADSYSIYYATEPDIAPDSIASYENGRWIENVTSPHIVGGLTNDETYYFVVTAITEGVESAPSGEISTTPRAIDLTAQPTEEEVLVMELVNRARFDPVAEAARYGIDLNDGVTADNTITPDRKAPLAHNLLLVRAARDHSQWMLDNNKFSHTGENGLNPHGRMVVAGYEFIRPWSAGENISWYGERAPTLDSEEAAYLNHEGLFKSSGHRLNILSETFRELGIGQKVGSFTNAGTEYLAAMLTQNFAYSGERYFLTGVVFEDTNDNEFYNPGEGLSDVNIVVNGQSYAAYSNGAYTIPLAAGDYSVSVVADSLGAPVERSITIGNANVKLDVIKSGDDIEVLSW